VVALLRVSGPQDTSWEVLPEQARQLPAERLVWPPVPFETVLRLLYLKQCCQFGYETLCREVATR
jgi:IS5 family transposase